jgi:hypothetical protein
MSSDAAKAVIRGSSQYVDGRGKFDFVIVDTGSAGCVVGRRLASGARRIGRTGPKHLGPAVGQADSPSGCLGSRFFDG